MKRLCTCLISMAGSRSNKLETKQKSKYKVDFNFYFHFNWNIFLKSPKYFGENPETNKNFIAHVL